MISLSSLSKIKLAAISLLLIVILLSVIPSTESNTPSWVAYVIVAACCLNVAIVHILIKRIDHIVHYFSETLQRTSEGNLEARLILVKEKGSLKTLSTSLNRFIDVTDAFMREICHSMQAVSRGEYHRKIVARGMLGIYRDSAAAINEVTKSTEISVGKFLEATQQFESRSHAAIQSVDAEGASLLRASQDLADVVQQTSHTASIVTSASDQMVNNVQTIAAATEELSTSVVGINTRAHDAADATRRAVEEAKRTDELVQSLNEAAHKIGDVVALINNIAAQTNLLALNATIEAARAGEAGKGFAVVAGEVKTLASQTARATDEITDHVNMIQQTTKEAVSLIGHVSLAIQHINGIAGSMTESIAQQKDATQEISRNIQATSTNARDVMANISDASVAATRTETAAQSVQNAAVLLNEQSTVLKSEIQRYIASVRSAK